MSSMELYEGRKCEVIDINCRRRQCQQKQKTTKMTMTLPSSPILNLRSLLILKKFSKTMCGLCTIFLNILNATLCDFLSLFAKKLERHKYKFRELKLGKKRKKKVWRQLSLNYLEKLYESMTRSMQAVVNAWEGQTKYQLLLDFLVNE